MTLQVLFPSGLIMDTDGIVWTALPVGIALADLQILGTCSVDPSSLVLQQVTVDQGAWRKDLIPLVHFISFPRDRAFTVVLDGLEQFQLRQRSESGVPIRVTVHVRRVSGGAERNERGRLLRLPEPVEFQLQLATRSQAQSEEVRS